MAHFRRTVVVALDAPAAFAFVSDFRNARHWDPRVISARKDSPGDIALGSRFTLVSKLLGRRVELAYEIVGFEPPTRLVFRGGNRFFHYLDTIVFEPRQQGCTLDYEATLTFRRLLSIVDVGFQPLFQRIGEDALRGIQRTLDAESGPSGPGGAR